MAKGRFNFLDETLNDTSKAQMNKDKMIDIDLIHPYEANDEIYPPEDYAMEREQLKESIREKGLIQSVELMPHPTLEGHYISIGGNRRCDVIRELVKEEGGEKYRMVKSHISVMDEVDAIEACIMSNNYRDKTPRTVLKEIEKLKWVADQRKQKGQKLNMSTRSWLALKTGLKESQAGKLNRINEKGIEELKKEIDSETISLESAAYIALLDENEQVVMVQKIKEGELSNKDVVDLVKEKRRNETTKPKKADDATQESLEIEESIEAKKAAKKEETWKKVKKLLKKLADMDPEHKDVIESFLTNVHHE